MKFVAHVFGCLDSQRWHKLYTYFYVYIVAIKSSNHHCYIMYIQIQAKTNAKRIHIQNKICTNEHLNSLRANPTFQKPRDK